MLWEQLGATMVGFKALAWPEDDRVAWYCLEGAIKVTGGGKVTLTPVT